MSFLKSIYQTQFLYQTLNFSTANAKCICSGKTRDHPFLNYSFCTFCRVISYLKRDRYLESNNLVTKYGIKENILYETELLYVSSLQVFDAHFCNHFTKNFTTSVTYNSFQYYFYFAIKF